MFAVYTFTIYCAHIDDDSSNLTNGKYGEMRGRSASKYRNTEASKRRKRNAAKKGEKSEVNPKENFYIFFERFKLNVKRQTDKYMDKQRRFEYTKPKKKIPMLFVCASNLVLLLFARRFLQCNHVKRVNGKLKPLKCRWKSIGTWTKAWATKEPILYNIATDLRFHNGKLFLPFHLFLAFIYLLSDEKTIYVKHYYEHKPAVTDAIERENTIQSLSASSSSSSPPFYAVAIIFIKYFRICTLHQRAREALIHYSLPRVGLGCKRAFCFVMTCAVYAIE